MPPRPRSGHRPDVHRTRHACASCHASRACAAAAGTENTASGECAAPTASSHAACSCAGVSSSGTLAPRCEYKASSHRRATKAPKGRTSAVSHAASPRRGLRAIEIAQQGLGEAAVGGYDSELVRPGNGQAAQQFVAADLGVLRGHEANDKRPLADSYGCNGLTAVIRRCAKPHKFGSRPGLCSGRSGQWVTTYRSRAMQRHQSPLDFLRIAASAAATACVLFLATHAAAQPLDSYATARAKLSDDLAQATSASSIKGVKWARESSSGRMLKVLVMARPTVDPDLVGLRAAIVAAGGSVYYRYISVNGVAAVVPAARLHDIARRPDVESVSPNRMTSRTASLVETTTGALRGSRQRHHRQPDARRQRRRHRVPRLRDHGLEPRVLGFLGLAREEERRPGTYRPAPSPRQHGMEGRLRPQQGVLSRQPLAATGRGHREHRRGAVPGSARPRHAGRLDRCRTRRRAARTTPPVSPPAPPSSTCASSTRTAWATWPPRSPASTG